MHGMASLASVRVRWALLELENFQHVQGFSRIDQEQLTAGQAARTSDLSERTTREGIESCTPRRRRPKHTGWKPWAL